MRSAPSLLLLTMAMTACGENARLPHNADVGPHPNLVEPKHTLVPTAHVAATRPWTDGETPTAAAGLRFVSCANGPAHPRWLHALPNGDVLVAETNAPPRPDEGQGLKGWVMKKPMSKVGSATPGANRITLLRDVDGAFQRSKDRIEQSEVKRPPMRTAHRRPLTIRLDGRLVLVPLDPHIPRGEVLELGVHALEGQLHGAHRAVTLFRNDDLGDTRLLALVLGVVLVPVDEHDYVFANFLAR